jgi:hypothetical protein
MNENPLLPGRRRFIAIAIGGAVSTLTLSGCGGGSGQAQSGGSGSLLTLSAAKGRLVLPIGSTLKISQVVNLFGTTALATDATFNFAQAAETPLLTAAYGPTGGAVLYGFLSNTSTELSAHSTAKVLAYFALGVGAYSQEIQSLYLSAITGASSLPALEAAIAAALLARGENWLDETDAALVAALRAIQNELSAHAFATRGVILDKPDRTSGLQVNADGVGSMTIANYYRRRSYVYVDRVSYKVKGTGDSVNFKGPILPQPTKILPVKGVSNTLANLGALFGGQRDFYEPVIYGPIGIPVNPTEAASTTYTATAVGLGVSPGDFGKLTQVQQDGWWEVSILAMLVDIVAPIIAGVVIPNLTKDINSFVDFAGTGGVLKDIVNAIAASPEIRNKAQSGKISDACWDVLLLIVKTDTLKNVFLQMVGDFLGGYAPPQVLIHPITGLPVTIPARATFIAQSGAKLSSFISKINIALQVFDTVVTGFQLSNCNNADVFTLEVTNAIAKLNPDQAVARPIQAAIPFTAVVTNADVQPDTTLSYQWSCPCLFGDISDGLHTNTKDGTTFDSSSNILTYAPNGKAVGGSIEQISVKIFKGPINKRTAIGAATSPVTFVTVKVTPTSAKVKANGTQVLTAELVGMRPLKVGEAIEFHWLTTRVAGELLGSADGGTTIPVIGTSATFQGHATKEGVDTVTVEAFLNGTSLGKASSQMTVGSGLVFATSVLGIIKEYGGRNPAIYIFYTLSGPPPTDWTRCDLQAPGFGTLYKRDYDHGAPAIDKTRNTDVSTFVPYDSYPGASTSGGGAFNLGGGLICFASRDVFGINYSASQVDQKLAELLKLVQDEGEVTATFT